MKALLEKARVFAIEKHRGQIDDSWQDYFQAHCQKVYDLISVVAPEDINLRCAALLHDTLEDTKTVYTELVKEFNTDVADLVREVTHEGQKDSTGYYFPHLKTRRGIMLKFADRLSNISRMEAWGEDRKAQYLKRSKFWKEEACRSSLK